MYSNAKILVVDDNLDNVLLLEKLLRISGYNNIRSTTDSREALPMYKKYKPDLVLLDLRMPFLDGFEVMNQFKELEGGDYLPIAIITANNDHEHRLKALQAGAKDFISKPFDHAEVLARINNMLEIRLLHNEVKKQNCRLEEKVQERTNKIQDLQIELIHRLVRAAEFRDYDTGGHVHRISLYANELARELGLDDKYCDLIMHASTMHDIGKIGISDEILLKPGKLSPKEWEHMKTHTMNGAQILAGSNSEMIMMAEEIAVSHHEKWDGSGYPQGLIGKDTPLSGRITAICDVFDALVSRRPYKEPWPIEMAMAEIERGSGTHFDPELVAAFRRIQSQLMLIIEKHI